jgi:hypothetical protein
MCGARLKSLRGLRIGRKITCPKCAIAFSVRPEDAREAERTAGVNGIRLAIVLAGALAVLGGGVGLAHYCFADNPAQQRAEFRASGEASDGDPTPETPPVAPPAPGAIRLADQRATDNAIANGVWYLKDHQLPTGAWGEEITPNRNWGRIPGVGVALTALPALTLLECGVPGDDPGVRKAAAFVRQKSVRPDLPFPVYQRSLAILFLDRLGDKEDEELIRYLGLCLLAGQHPTEGAWSYNCPTLDRARVSQLFHLLEDRKQSLENWRKSALEGIEFQDGGWDNSNTQFAVLALWVAQRHGVAIDRASRLAEEHFRHTQVRDGTPDRQGINTSLGGSWYYDGRPINSSGWPSMTCSGLLGLAVTHGLDAPETDKKANPNEDPAIQRALAMLAREIDRSDERRPHDYYFLWSLERVGVLYNLPKIGGKDWYAWGRNELLAKQQVDGSWRGDTFWGSNEVLGTSFALLFLKQANLAKDLTHKLQLLIATEGPPLPAPAKKE